MYLILTNEPSGGRILCVPATAVPLQIRCSLHVGYWWTSFTAPYCHLMLMQWFCQGTSFPPQQLYTYIVHWCKQFLLRMKQGKGLKRREPRTQAFSLAWKWRKDMACSTTYTCIIHTLTDICYYVNVRAMTFLQCKVYRVTTWKHSTWVISLQAKLYIITYVALYIPK